MIKEITPEEVFDYVKSLMEDQTIAYRLLELADKFKGKKIKFEEVNTLPAILPCMTSGYWVLAVNSAGFTVASFVNKDPETKKCSDHPWLRFYLSYDRVARWNANFIQTANPHRFSVATKRNVFLSELSSNPVWLAGTARALNVLLQAKEDMKTAYIILGQQCVPDDSLVFQLIQNLAGLERPESLSWITKVGKSD